MLTLGGASIPSNSSLDDVQSIDRAAVRFCHQSLELAREGMSQNNYQDQARFLGRAVAM